ncbi:MAG: endonuclease III [Patescibacteria group bacterium]|nr:endonuclease III [Patescibacteria group bacterium]
MTPQKLRERRARILKLDRALKKLFPQARIELKYGTPLQLLVAVQLSAQCTDKMVNKITAKLFKKYKTLDDYVRAGKTQRGVREFEQMIRSSGFYKNKTKNILAAVKIIQEKFAGKVPKRIDDLLLLPGVARKTATVVLSEAYGIVAGITVDTHVIRFVQRFDLSDYTDPVRIEKDLMLLLPKKEWPHFTHRVIHYGRYLAPARIYDTTKDPLVKIYPKAAKRFRVYKVA